MGQVSDLPFSGLNDYYHGMLGSFCLISPALGGSVDMTTIMPNSSMVAFAPRRMPTWAKLAIDAWTAAAEITDALANSDARAGLTCLESGVSGRVHRLDLPRAPQQPPDHERRRPHLIIAAIKAAPARRRPAFLWLRPGKTARLHYLCDTGFIV